MAWRLIKGDGPLVAAAIHSGHSVRPDVAEIMAVDEDERLREQDPYTDGWTSIVPNQIHGTSSRFEVNFNRPRENAVYLTAESSWGLNVWKDPPPDSMVQASLAIYDAFYEEVREFLDALVSPHERIVIYDLHSYNHRRNGPDEPHADSDLNPEVNLGTGTMYRRCRATIVDRFLDDLRDFEFHGRQLDMATL